MTTDTITAVVWVAILPVWLVWECILLKDGDRTISQIARQRGWQFSSLVFFWSSMPFHWWCPSPWPAFTAGTVTFWAIIAGLLIYNLRTRVRHSRALAFWPTWDRWLNWPVWYLIAGPLLAVLLFPQRQTMPWGP